MPVTVTECDTVADVAECLNISVRTAHRRISKGQFETIERDGKRVILVPTATSVMPDGRPLADSGTPDDSPKSDRVLIDQLQKRLESAEADATAWRSQADAWRLQSEASNRMANEAMAALRNEQKRTAKELLSGSNDAPQTDTATTSTPATDPTPHAATDAPQNDTGGDDLEQNGTQKRESPATEGDKSLTTNASQSGGEQLAQMQPDETGDQTTNASLKSPVKSTFLSRIIGRLARR